jgi:hypothetical protein
MSSLEQREGEDEDEERGDSAKHWARSRVLTHICSDTIENIAKVEPAIADVPCDNILGLVIYDLPGRDCAAKASNGELKAGDVSTYKTQYIDRKAKLPVAPLGAI